MGKRRRGRGVAGEKIKDTPDHIATPARVVQVTGIQCHTTLSKVLSRWDHDQPDQTIIVSNAINTNIFPRYK